MTKANDIIGEIDPTKQKCPNCSKWVDSHELRDLVMTDVTDTSPGRVTHCFGSCTECMEEKIKEISHLKLLSVDPFHHNWTKS